MSELKAKSCPFCGGEATVKVGAESPHEYDQLRTLRALVKAADALRDAVRDMGMGHDKQCFMMRYGGYCDCGLPALKEAIEAYDKAKGVEVPDEDN